MSTLLAFTAPPGTVDFTGGIAIFGNDFKANVQGQITGIWYFHTSTNEGANAGVQAHRVSDQQLMGSKSFSTAALTDNAWNLITLDSPINYPTPNDTWCLAIHYPSAMGFAFTDGLNDLTSGNLTVIRNTARFKNTGSPALGTFPSSNDTTVGFAAGIEFTASGGTVFGSASINLGGVTATGNGKRIVYGNAVSNLGGVTAKAVIPSAKPGSWYTLLAIEEERRETARRLHSSPPVACPNDGEPLRTTPYGTRRCPFDGWEWPTDGPGIR